MPLPDYLQLLRDIPGALGSDPNARIYFTSLVRQILDPREEPGAKVPMDYEPSQKLWGLMERTHSLSGPELRLFVNSLPAGPLGSSRPPEPPVIPAGTSTRAERANLRLAQGGTPYKNDNVLLAAIEHLGDDLSKTFETPDITAKLSGHKVDGGNVSAVLSALSVNSKKTPARLQRHASNLYSLTEAGIEHLRMIL